MDTFGLIVNFLIFAGGPILGFIILVYVAYLVISALRKYLRN